MDKLTKEMDVKQVIQGLKARLDELEDEERREKGISLPPPGYRALLGWLDTEIETIMNA